MQITAHKVKSEHSISRVRLCRNSVNNRELKPRSTVPRWEQETGGEKDEWEE